MATVVSHYGNRSLTLHSSSESLGSVAPRMSSSEIGMLSREIGSFSFPEKLSDSDAAILH